MSATLPLTTPTAPSPPPPPPPPPPSPSKPKASMITITAILSYIVSVPLLCYGIWLLLIRDHVCQSYLHMPPHLRETIAIGLLSLFLISCFVTHYEARLVLPGALTLAVALLGMLIFGVLLTGDHSMQTRAVPGSPFWIKQRIDDHHAWNEVKGCIFDLGTCQNLAYDTFILSKDDFGNKSLTSIESGCCKPPNLCGMKYVNATYWERSEDINTSWQPYPPTNETNINPETYQDCQAWSNSITQLCYDCKSCKLAFISTIHREWKHRGIFMISMSSFLILVHTPRFVFTMIHRNRS